MLRSITARRLALLLVCGLVALVGHVASVSAATYSLPSKVICQVATDPQTGELAGQIDITPQVTIDPSYPGSSQGASQWIWRSVEIWRQTDQWRIWRSFNAPQPPGLGWRQYSRYPTFEPTAFIHVPFGIYYVNTYYLWNWTNNARYGGVVRATPAWSYKRKEIPDVGAPYWGGMWPGGITFDDYHGETQYCDARSDKGVVTIDPGLFRVPAF